MNPPADFYAEVNESSVAASWNLARREAGGLRLYSNDMVALLAHIWKLRLASPSSSRTSRPPSQWFATPRGPLPRAPGVARGTRRRPRSSSAPYSSPQEGLRGSSGGIRHGPQIASGVSVEPHLLRRRRLPGRLRVTREPGESSNCGCSHGASAHELGSDWATPGWWPRRWRRGRRRWHAGTPRRAESSRAAYEAPTLRRVAFPGLRRRRRRPR
mmetsp:Transcript_19202/g.61776  ORF Transcript_19202/g.61776 Transcript_19202/m.61776 type:complete len:214 (+) Transcript_19202:3019-3660(+)